VTRLVRFVQASRHLMNVPLSDLETSAVKPPFAFARLPVGFGGDS
jgi:hypothetical protein